MEGKGIREEVGVSMQENIAASQMEHTFVSKKKKREENTKWITAPQKTRTIVSGGKED